ncbi:hypothetical protein A3K34_04295 [candidate division WWE3 bacterium RIFOXYC1_FULL_40_10]|uniref:Polymerase nucleotidyl transferase domain-containing protein n=1 Tax=candidate division WWE3 bacterium RIFOXYA2_FULL_46_9 TaxID=1802636 RepID=A0A1F4W0X6_UNCKA|nr:MAG: hypothetical protein A3K58_04295 [candidate division WWE3 bacterium RIFOXYB1_FULL_40_22]OGC62062.1 MAG: hypothetical protein A3K37_04295 [candidate division WWE3 bacterium RIFOXYA1_FULL_40_11]OGC63077.1 MAG: hypothetical protein A2264_00040 [candidate division WWE3 bacterium RIFOXYA2_FULL_46_9]OGC64993.1 MAG: hypothetical protein A2326_03070 [candidate division WWE3 bacterium RIFOXYB2_FULL_41_6]OGC66445.1 MAG: hypothetical protein A3K34_04295 [candidate division WWE3 bacterium RIFOXYC1_
MAFDCKDAILKTLAYRTVFDYPLSYYQLCTFLVTDTAFSGSEVAEAIKKLISEDKIKRKNHLYYLSGCRPVKWGNRQKNSRHLIRENTKVIGLIGSLPWVRYVGITGSVAAYSATSNSDLDLFIVTQKNRIWLVRGFVALILIITNKYPKNGSEAGRICPNLYVDEANMVWEKSKRNLYIAHDILLMQPIINKRDYYFKFMRANDWVFKYFANFPIDLPLIFRNKRVIRGRFLDFIEWLAMKMQLYYMKRRKTTEVVEKGIIHFNKNDCTNRVLSTYGKILEGYGIK